eukprot:TRINITY_DN15403_c0_g1_i2.p1 TRINITY_DN15403_c0_g1~~TRINITY_DN15403_c0_g1_i2.p1  ORF type:complete len:174 (-),score=30.11 TRINITY_DN15403_c0_g1_i2:174-695(-)
MSLPLRVLGSAAAPRVTGQRTPKGSKTLGGSPVAFFADMSPKTPRTPKTPTTPKTPLNGYVEDRFMGKAAPFLNLVHGSSPRSAEGMPGASPRSFALVGASPRSFVVVEKKMPVLLGRAANHKPSPSPATSPPSTSARRVCFEMDAALLSVCAREAYVGRQKRIRERFGPFRV